MTRPATFGDVTGEYLALRRGAGLVTGTREIVWAGGDDVVSFLDGLVSQSVAGLATGAVARSLLLTPQGKLGVPHHVLRGAAAVGLVTEAGWGERLVADLNRFKIRVDVGFEVDPRPTLAVWGPAGSRVVSELAAAPGSGEWIDESGVLVADLPLVHGGIERSLLAGIRPEDAAAAGGTLVGSDAWTSVRVERGEPALGIDIDEATIPEEAGLVSGAVDFGKGCYLGQELVARIDSRGRVTRRLRGLVIAENVLPPVGAEVRGDDGIVGGLTSVGESLELRAPVALAMIRHEVEPGSAVVIAWNGGSTSAEVRTLPMV